jgi:hypothetical protein
MSTQGSAYPRQFKVSIGPPVRRKQRRKAKPKADAEVQPIEARLLQSPQLKAVVPYTPKNELEDSQLRFLIYHCKPNPPSAVSPLPHEADKEQM